MDERNILIDAIRNKHSSILYNSPLTGYIYCYITYAGNKEQTEETIQLPPITDKYVYINFDYNKMTIGPIFQRDHIGCPQCFEERRKFNRYYHQNENGETITILNDIDLFPLDTVPHLLETLFRRRGDSESSDYYLVDSRLDIQLSTFWPLDPCNYCRVEKNCHDIEKIESALAENLYYPYGTSYRRKQNRESFDRVFDYSNIDCGFFVFQDFDGEALFSVSSHFPINHSDRLISGTGTGNDFHDSVYISYFEGLERYAGIQPRGREDERVLDSFESLSKRKRTVDPSDFLQNVIGENKDNNLYSPYKKTFWIPAFSYSERTTVYVPESFVYYKYNQEYDGNKYKIYKGNSNGNAIGTHLLDAIYYACLELIERDAFLNHWYLQHTPKRIDLSSIDEAEITRMVNHLLTLQYDVAIYDITMEFDIPTFWVFCRGKTDERIATYSTAGAHHNPLKAITSALVEMVYAIEYYDINSKMIKEKALDIKETGVRKLIDHPMLYALETESYLFDFLDDGHKLYTLSDLFPSDIEKSNNSVNFNQIVHELLEKFIKQFGDVYIVRQTPEGYEQLGLEVVKILIPNIQQLWFGEENREISMVRINQAKKIWGYAHAELNEAPHPFP